MDGFHQLQKIAHRSKARVKSGCLTCRIRKVKCDEDRPACRRCVSTGRTCGGYGVWGGGGSAPGHASGGFKNSEVVSWCALPTNPISTTAVSREEKGYLDWFKYRTVVKLPGIFVSKFWDTLIFQASADEPAVFHAVLALSAVHQSENLNGNRLGSPNSLLSEQEKFMLLHYSKAINCLQPRCSVKSRESVRVALIACVIFICVELLRGHYRTAQIHIRNGVKLLREIGSFTETEVDGLVTLNLSQEPAEDWIAEALSSLHTRTILFNLIDRSPYLGLLTIQPKLQAFMFESFNEAKLHLDQLLNKIFSLSEQSRHQAVILDYAECPSYLVERQQHIRAELSSWLGMFNASKARLQVQTSLRNEFTYHLLCNYHTMAKIMACTCLGPAFESRFDSHIKDFVSIIVQSIRLYQIRFYAAISLKMYGPPGEESHSISEMGWIPPLYYVALKCREHRVRLHAIRLLELSPHREGIWVATIAAAVMRKVMELEEREIVAAVAGKVMETEERGVYENLCFDDDFSLSSSPEEEDLLLPALPEQNRIHEVQIAMPDEPAGKVKLLYKRKKEAGIWEVYESEYDIPTQLWKDGKEPAIESMY